MSNSKSEDQSICPAQSSNFLVSYAELIGWVRLRIFSEKNIDDLLMIARFYGALCWANFSGRYQDAEVEAYVANKVTGEKHIHVPPMTDAGNNTVLIVSELHDSGGHSRVVLNWLKAFKKDDGHTLLITRSMTKRIEHSLIEDGAPYHLCTAESIELIEEILKQCANARRIVLHIHPDDIVSATAAKLMARSGKQIIFYNHADHVFSYGMSSADIVCEVSCYGIALNERTGRAGKSCYLGIPICEARPRKPFSDSRHRIKTVLSCGASYKYAPSPKLSFGDFIDKLLLQGPNVVVALVGPTGHEPWWADRTQCWGNRVRFLGELSHERYIELMEGSDIYVDSFPITGGTAFPEALLNGKLVAGLQNPVQGYSPVDELRVDTIDSLVRKVFDLIDSDSAALKEMESARAKAIEAHSLNKFRIRVEAMYAGEYCGYPWNSLIASDLNYLERQWQAKQEIYFSIRQICRLPPVFCLAFMLRLYRIQKGLIYSLALRLYRKLMAK